MSEDDRQLLRCDLCKHFNEPTSHCRRRAPVVLLETNYSREREHMYEQPVAHWPTVTVDSWCGEWNA